MRFPVLDRPLRVAKGFLVGVLAAQRDRAATFHDVSPDSHVSFDRGIATPLDGAVKFEPAREREVDPGLSDDAGFFMGALVEARSLKNSGARFHYRAGGRLQCDIEGVLVNVRTHEEMLILQETFADRVYDFEMPDPAVIWDIGMNVGFVSLFFASRGDTRVVGYEPIESTYRLALDNLELNPSLRDAIIPINSGVGASTRTEMVDYCYDAKGSVGIRGAAGDPIMRRLIFHLPLDVPMWKEALHMKDAATELASIRTAHPGLPIVAKIDCEGAEYEIVEALHRSGDLQTLHALLIEWHRDGPAKLKELLVDAGFAVICPGSPKDLWGKIYAVRVTV